MNRNGSRTLCVFKVHYRDCAGSGRKLLQIHADLVFGPYGQETARRGAESESGFVSAASGAEGFIAFAPEWLAVRGGLRRPRRSGL